MSHRRLIRVSLVAALAAIVIAGLLAAASSASGPTVHIAGSTTATYHFKPKKVTVSKGTTVHWSWSSNAPHNVTFTKLGKHSATGASGSYKLKFKHAGTFKYLCTVHGFTGKVVVK